MDFNTWVNLFQFIKEIVKRPTFDDVRKRENRARNLHTLAFLGMFLFAMLMTEQAVIYSTAKHDETVELLKVSEELDECIAALPYYTATQGGQPDGGFN